MTGTFGAASTALVHEMFFPMYVVKALVGVAQDEQVGKERTLVNNIRKHGLMLCVACQQNTVLEVDDPMG